jgi:hypothetical protein
LKQPFPLISKTANNEPYKGMIDSLGFELPATYEASPVGVEDPNIAKFTHTGYSSGIVYPLGIWQCNTGITQLYASLGDARITADNKQFWACNAFKLRFDRSSLNVENYSDPDTYDKFGIVMNSALADNSPYVVRVDGTGEGYSSLGNNTDVNSHGYLLNSLNMPEYIDDYTLITGYSNPTITDLEQNDCRPYFAIRTNIEPNNILHLDIHSTANSGFSMYGFIDIEGNPMLTENYNKNRLRRMMIVPNEGIDLNVNNTDDWIYTTTKPLDRLDYTVISPGGGIIVGAISFDGSNLEVQMKLDDQTGPEPYSLTKDIEHLKQTYPRYPIPKDTDKIEVRIDPLFTDTDLGTLELVGDSLEFTPGADLTIDNPAKFNITYVFDTSTPDTDNLAVDYYKTTGSTTAVFSLRN